MAEQLVLPFVEKDCNICEKTETVIKNKETNEQSIHVTCKRCGADIEVKKAKSR
jgi:transposase-like protein